MRERAPADWAMLGMAFAVVMLAVVGLGLLP